MSAAIADPTRVVPGTDWLTHAEFAAANDREPSTCTGQLRVVCRTAVGKTHSVLEIECSEPDCLFELTTDDESFRRALAKRGEDNDDDLAWWQK